MSFNGSGRSDFLPRATAKERAKKRATRNRKRGNPESRGRATEGQIVTIREYDAYCTPGQQPLSAGIEKGATRNLKRGNSSKKYKLKEVDQKQIHVPLRESLDAPLSVSDSDCKNGKASKTTPPHQIADHFRATINPRARLTAKTQKRIEARLRAYSVPDLCMAIDGWKNDRWQMEHNAQRGMAWFFATDDRIEQWIPKAAVETNGEATNTTAAAEQPAKCMCPNCLCCDAPRAADNALCTRCQSGACWKDPTTGSPQQPTPESPQQNVPRTGLWAFVQQEHKKKPEKTESPQAPIQPHRATNEKPGLKPAREGLWGQIQAVTRNKERQSKRKAA